MSRRIAIGCFVVLTLLPLVAGFVYSLLYSFGLAGLLGKGFTWMHWMRLASEGEALQALGYTLVLTLASLLLSVLPALGLSYLLCTAKHKSRLEGLFYIPMAFPPLLAAFAMYYLLSPSGLFSRMAYGLGWSDGVAHFPRLVNDAASIGILAAHVFLLLPFFTLHFLNLARKERVPALLESARTLGAREGDFLRRIFVPLLLRRSAPLLLLYGVLLFGAYEVPLLLGRSTPRTVAVLITEKLSRFDLTAIPVAHALGVVYVLCIGTLLTVFLRRSALGGLLR
jgi:putative spermidine/putrescine transport system permease protein